MANLFVVRDVHILTLWSSVFRCVDSIVADQESFPAASYSACADSSRCSFFCWELTWELNLWWRGYMRSKEERLPDRMSDIDWDKAAVFHCNLLLCQRPWPHMIRTSGCIWWESHTSSRRTYLMKTHRVQTDGNGEQRKQKGALEVFGAIGNPNNNKFHRNSKQMRGKQTKKNTHVCTWQTSESYKQDGWLTSDMN